MNENYNKLQNIRELMKGTSENHFSPDAALTREMLVTVLYRLEGEPEITNDKSFADVENGNYYEKAITTLLRKTMPQEQKQRLFLKDLLKRTNSQQHTICRG